MERFIRFRAFVAGSRRWQGHDHLQ